MSPVAQFDLLDHEDDNEAESEAEFDSDTDEVTLYDAIDKAAATHHLSNHFPSRASHDTVHLVQEDPSDF